MFSVSLRAVICLICFPNGKVLYVALVIVSLILEYSTTLKDILISYSNPVHVLDDV